MSTGIRLIAGLGNPGLPYENTRHNAGAWFIETLASAAGVSLRQASKFHGRHGVLQGESGELHLLLPSTFMNLSGQSISAVARYYSISTDTLLVAHDDIDLAVGDVRLKFDGGHGGHNGLRSIISHLSSAQFHRLRIGVGHPGHSDDVTDYVLSAPSKQERREINHVLEKAEGILPALLCGQFKQATQALNTREK